MQDVDYDSADSAVSDLSEDEEEDVFDGDSIRDKPSIVNKENTEHSNPQSYSWCIMRLAIIKLCQGHLQDFLNIAGIETQGTCIILKLHNFLCYIIVTANWLFICHTGDPV